MNQAIATIETKGFVTAVAAIDHMLKSANVQLVGYKKKLGSSLVTMTISGDIGAVNVAIHAGVARGNEVGEVVGTHVIARTSPNVKKVFNLTEESHQGRVVQGALPLDDDKPNTASKRKPTNEKTAAKPKVTKRKTKATATKEKAVKKKATPKKPKQQIEEKKEETT